MPKYLIVSPSSYSIFKKVDMNNAVSISEITIVMALIVTKKDFCMYEPPKQNTAIKDHSMIVAKILEANGRYRFVRAKFINTAIQKYNQNIFPIPSFRSSMPLK